MTQCVNEEFGKLISQYELGCLSDEERDRFEEHLMECDFCLRELEQMRPIMSALRQDRVGILDGLRHDGISFESLKTELLSRSRRDVSLLRRMAIAISQVWSNLRQAQVLVPAISILFALVLVRAYCPDILKIFKTERQLPPPTTLCDGGVDSAGSSPTIRPGGGLYIDRSSPFQILGHFEPHGSFKTPTAESLVTLSIAFCDVMGHSYSEGRRAPTDYDSSLSFEPLPYQPMELRGTAGEEERFFDEGMEYYLKGNYRSAISHLANAVEKTPENGTWWLYLGVCYYLERDTKAAVKALTHADTLAQFSDKTRARWYLAQAHLLNEDANQAIPLLQWLIDQRKTYAGKADSLLAMVRSVQALEHKEATPK